MLYEAAQGHLLDTEARIGRETRTVSIFHADYDFLQLDSFQEFPSWPCVKFFETATLYGQTIAS